jgi:hypothetical protein
LGCNTAIRATWLSHEPAYLEIPWGGSEYLPGYMPYIIPAPSFPVATAWFALAWNFNSKSMFVPVGQSTDISGTDWRALVINLAASNSGIDIMSGV